MTDRERILLDKLARLHQAIAVAIREYLENEDGERNAARRAAKLAAEREKEKAGPDELKEFGKRPTQSIGDQQ
jgi:hypothetical protein